MFEIHVSAEFEAAHRVAGYPGKCDRLHWEGPLEKDMATHSGSLA